jgi:hypothetical protein
MRHVKLVMSLVAAAVMLALPASAMARSRDRNHDRIPDRWERVHHLSLKVNQARRDQDHDGLPNRAEYRAHMDPRDADSDDDGIKDGNEHAGTVDSFDGTMLTIAVFGGTKLTGRVTGNTDIECDPGDDNGEGQTDAAAWRSDELGSDDGDAADQQPGADEGDNPAEDQGDDQGGDEGDENSCPLDALVRGAIVQEADLSLTSEGLVFDSIELVG